MILLLAMLFLEGQVPVQRPGGAMMTTAPDLPEAPKAHYNFPSRIGLTVSTQKLGNKLNRQYSGGVTYQVSPELTISGGYAVKGWAASAYIKPFARLASALE